MTKLRVLALSLGILGGLIISGCVEKDNQIPPNPLVNISPTIGFKKIWVEKLGKGTGGKYLILDPIASDTLTFSDHAGNIFRVAADSGKLLGSYHLKVNLTTGISENKETIFVPDSSGSLLAINKETGKLIWSKQLGGQILSRPLVTPENILIVTTTSGGIIALNSKNGEIIWYQEQPIPDQTLHLTGRPILAGKYLLTGFANGTLVCFLVKTGEIVWQYQLANYQDSKERFTDLVSQPLVKENIVIAGDYQGSLVALRLHSGRLIWRHRIASFQNMALSEKQFYVVDRFSDIWSFNIENGLMIWHQNLLQGRKITGVNLFGNNLIAADRFGYVHLLDPKTGQLLGRERLSKNGFLSQPIALGNRIYLYDVAGIAIAASLEKIKKS